MAEKKISIIDYVAPEKQRSENEYDSLVAALIEAGEGKAALFDVPADSLGKEKVRVREAANYAGYTARVIEGAPDPKRKVVPLTVQLRPRIYRTRKETAESETEEG